jgi:molybdopterin converting factor small subunit
MKIHIPTPLRQYTEKQATVEVQAATVGEALKKLTGSHPDLRRHLYNEEGKLRAFVNVYLNDEESDSLSIVPSIAGGASLELR